MRDNSRYFHGGRLNFSQLKETGLGGKLRIEAIMAEHEHFDGGPSIDTLHEWADEASILQVALAQARADSRNTSKRSGHDYIPGARAQLERKLS